MLSMLIRIYTPFISALIALIHGVLLLSDYDGILLWILGELTGHSVLMIAYILATSRRMCKWYKITVILLLLPHLINIGYYLGWVSYNSIIYLGIIIAIFSLIAFLIYRVTVGITKVIC